MNDKDIIKALELCCDKMKCNECPYRDKNCLFVRDVLNLINRQQAEIERLKAVEEAHREHNGQLRREIERLKKHSGKCIYLSDDETTEYCVEAICPKYKTEEDIRAKAITEFVERLKKEICTKRFIFSFKDIDQIAKEMGGGVNG